MTKNPILDELHAAREKLLTDAGGDLDQLVACVDLAVLVDDAHGDPRPVGQS